VKNRVARALLATIAALAVTMSGARPAVARPEDVAKAVRQAAAKRGPVAPAPPPANVSLAIDAPTTRGTWTMRVTNGGDVPVTIAADSRLLMLDVTPRGARKAEHCELPSDMRPQDDLQRPLVLPPHREYSETFEPRLYCLESKRLDALAPGAIVVASLGWSGHGGNPPLEVSPTAGPESQVAPSKSIVAQPIALADEPTPPAPPAYVRRADAAADIKLGLRSAKSLDAPSPSEIAIPVTLRNEGSRTAIVRFRPEMLAFDVVGPAGPDHCGYPALASAPQREGFTTLAPGREIELTIILSEYCATRVLEPAGLFVVRASLDTRRASGVDIGVRSFDGIVIATSPTVVRLRHGSLPAPLLTPHLQPLLSPP
jgi:hypothetical protein